MFALKDLDLSCYSERRHPLMLYTIKPLQALNNSEPVYSELEGTL